jgi:hypothetical protein
VSTLSLRVLNRALLQRQFLLARTGCTPLAVIRRLVAMQAQEPNWPFVGLWSRIRDFEHAGLTTLLADRRVVRSGLLRSTQHLAETGDFRHFRPLLQPVLDRTAGAAYFSRNNAGLDTAELVAAGLEFLGDQATPRKELAQRLAERYPGRDGRILIDGRVHGSWSLSGGELRLTPFRPLPADDRAALEDEAQQLLPFVGAGSVSFPA